MINKVNKNGDIFISHPGLQHAHQLAWALHEQGLLQAFWSGIPVTCADEKPPFWIPDKYAKRVKKTGIPSELRRHPMFFQVLLKAGALLPKSISREDYSHRIFHLFDWWISQHIAKLRPRVVIAYENSAYHTFRAAKAIGAKCILDAPSLHHQSGATLMEVKKTPYSEEINFRKDKEIELADLVLTCSPLAADSYVNAGVNTNKVHPMLLGATLPDGIDEWHPHSNPLHFIFAGVLSHRKAIDIILAVFKRLNSESLPYKLSFVGGEGEPGWIQKINELPNATYYPNIAQSKLYQMLAQADCLLLPSRFDSFGMVAAEAMACGTPAIVSTQTGAKALIEHYPGSGWVVECDENSLFNCIKEKILHRRLLSDARPRATEASHHFTWEAYRRRAGAFIQRSVA